MKRRNQPIGNQIIQLMSVPEDVTIHVPTFNKALTPHFKKRVYTWREVAYCESFSDPLIRYASTFAAKEAILKAIRQINHSIILPLNKIKIRLDRLAGTLMADIIIPGYSLSATKLSVTFEGEYVHAIALVKDPWSEVS